MGGCYFFKYNGGDSGIKISVFYWRCSLIRVPVITGSALLDECTYCLVAVLCNKEHSDDGQQ
jgi:hypothetical protein